MRNSKPFWRAINSLAHPVSIGMVALALLNDHVLRQHWPSWWTGKLSDFAWLVFAPFLLAALLAWVIPTRHEAKVGWLSFWLTGIGFTLAKTIPFVHGLAKGTLETLIGGQVTLIVDPTDLITLPALLVGWHIWQQAGTRTIELRPRGWVILTLAALATVATSYPAPVYGVSCLHQDGSSLLLISEYAGQFSVSEDGGFTWQETNLSPNNIPPCRRNWQNWNEAQAWFLANPANENIQYYLRPGEGVDISRDGGLTWTLDIDLAETSQEARLLYQSKTVKGTGGVPFVRPGPLDAIFEEQTGNLVLAMGYDGVLVRTPDGQWNWVAVGPYALENLNRPDIIFVLLEQELALAALVGLLLLSSIIEPLRNETTCWGVGSLMAAWALWAGVVLLYAPISRINTFGFSIDFIFPVAALVSAALGFSVGLIDILDVTVEKPKALLPMVAIAVIAMLLFLIPYILWTQGAVQHYSTATLFGFILVATTVYAGQQYMKRVFQGRPLMRKRKKVEAE